MIPKAARPRLAQIVLLWLGWAVLMLGYQAVAPGRFEPQRPDRATAWTAAETGADAHRDQPYVRGPVLNRQVAWDSEYYVSIALHGYDDPAMRAIAPGSDLGAETVGRKGAHPAWTSVNAAFFPAYPMAMRLAGWPLAALGLAPIAAVTVAGVLISLAGTLAAMVAVADLAGGLDGAGAGDGLRAAAYLLIWPASFFLAQVYTEGLFLGLSFGALVLARREHWLAAGALAIAAVFTRSTGALLVLPLAWMWAAGGGIRRLRSLTRGDLAALAAVAAPVGAYLVWRAIFGVPFEFIETRHFGRGLLWLQLSWSSWSDALALVRNGEPQARAYYLVEAWGVLAALGATAWLLRRDPALALYGLAILGIAMTSGAAQGMHRYVLSLPALFLAPARLGGRWPVFDRLWAFGNTLALAVMALAFSWDFWAG